MNCVCSKKQTVVVGKQQLVCLSLMLLLLLMMILSQSERSGFADNGDKGRFANFKSRPSATTATVLRSHEKPGGGWFKKTYATKMGNGDGDGDKVFDAEKRRIHTGPNPLHNRLRRSKKRD